MLLYTALLFTTVLAAPASDWLSARDTSVYDATNPPVLFTDATCTLSKSLTAGEPFSADYSTALALGAIIDPILDATIGHQTVEDIDTVADDLCINAQQTPNEGNGLCQDALQAIDDFATQITPAGTAAKYQCLLNLLCIAREGVPYNGLCQYLLAGQDCIANRVIGADSLECE